jgi:hypothetical protein
MKTMLKVLFLFIATTSLVFAASNLSPAQKDKNPNYNVGKRVGAIMQKVAKDVKKGKLTKGEAAQVRSQVNSIVKSAQPVRRLSPTQLQQVDAQLKQIYDSL